MIKNIIMILLGFALLLVGADILVKGASNIAKKFKIPEIIIGLTIVSIGTSLPELIITITSATKGYSDLIIGNALGSNICNMLLILGIISMINPVKMDKEIKKIHLPLSVFTTIFVLFMANGAFGSGRYIITKFDGMVLLFIFVLYFFYPIFTTIKDISKNKDEEKMSKKRRGISVYSSIILIIFGVVLLKYGGDFVVDYSTAIARYFNMSERLIGLTIIAIGTALPELVTSIIAVTKNDEGLAIGNLVGSNMLNLCLILGVGAVITPLTFVAEFNLTLLILAVALLVVWMFNYIGKGEIISRYEGAALVFMFALYMINMFTIG